MKHNFNCIVFDLDGTLIHSIPDVRFALNHILSQYGGTPLALQEIYPLIGKGARHLLQEAAKKGQIKLSKKQIDEALKNYLQYYKEHPVTESIVYPGVVNVLNQLMEEGIQLGICTNKPSIMTHIVLEQLALKKYFTAIVSGDECKNPKPHEEHLETVLSKMALAKDQAVMVGDSHVDFLCAERANIPFIGVSYGYDLDASTNLNFPIINHFYELPKALHHISEKGKMIL